MQYAPWNKFYKLKLPIATITKLLLTAKVYQQILKTYSFFLQAASLEPNDLDLSSSEDEQTKVSNGKSVHSKSALKPKLSNSSSKSGDEGSLHFDLPEHLKATAQGNLLRGIVKWSGAV
jgi:hypothetical protein